MLLTIHHAIFPRLLINVHCKNMYETPATSIQVINIFLQGAITLCDKYLQCRLIENKWAFDIRNCSQSGPNYYFTFESKKCVEVLPGKDSAHKEQVYRLLARIQHQSLVLSDNVEM